MKALLGVMLLATIAEAGPVKPPAGWTGDPAASVSMSKKLGEVPHFGGLSTYPTTEVYRAPAGGSLFVTRAFAAPKPEDRNRAASIELGEIRAAMTRAAGTPDSGQVRELSDLKLLEARVAWRDPSTGIATTSRMVIAADDKQVVAVTGECVLAGDAAPDVVTACTAALASLDPEIPLDKRVSMNLVSDAVGSAAPAPAGSSAPALGSSSAGASMLEGGERPALPPMTIPQPEREQDRRPVYVGIGLVVLALLFWWNRKNREKLERAYEERVGASDKPRDPDADDLHAAASDETKSSGTTTDKDE